MNHIDEIHSCDLVDMVKYSRVNRGYKYIFTNIDIFSKYSWSFPLKTKTVKEIKSCFQKIFKERKRSYIWSDQESAFSSKEMLKFFEDYNIKIYYTNSNLKAVIIDNKSNNKFRYYFNDITKFEKNKVALMYVSHIF